MTELTPWLRYVLCVAEEDTTKEDENHELTFGGKLEKKGDDSIGMSDLWDCLDGIIVGFKETCLFFSYFLD